MFEKRFKAVAPQLLTSNGTVNGQVTVADASLYKVKSVVSLQNASVGAQQFQVQRITDIHTIFLGPLNSSNIVNDRSDVSAWTTALGSFVFSAEQQRTLVPEEQIERWTYEEEPVVARRVILVDKVGDKYSDTNPLPVAFDGTISIGDVSIVDDGNTLGVNPDGSINVNVVNSTSLPGLNILYNEASSVASGIETNVITFVATGGGFRLNKIYVAGENIALFRVKLNGTVIVVKRTFFGNLNEEFAFENFVNGLELAAGDQIRVTVLHTRPSASDFEATIMGLNL